jgi:DNA polymerase
MTSTVILDVETRSALDLKKVGAARYAAHPTTDVWCAAYAIDDDPAVRLWQADEPVPAAIIEAAADPNCLFVAHNAGFERAILQHVLTPPRYGWPAIPVERWRCTMAASLALALPPALNRVAAVLALPQQKADKVIVRLMAKPRLPRGNEDPKGVYWFDDAEHRQALYDYCKQDVETERALWRWLPPLSDAEQQLWCFDQGTNDGGFYVDRPLTEKAIAITAAADAAAQAELQQIVNDPEIVSTHQRDKLLVWLAARGCELKDFQKATLSAALRRKELAPDVRRVLELRQQTAHAAADKFEALRAWRGRDGRVRGCFKFHGAATGRWSANGPQPQNFRRETENTAAKFSAVMADNIAEAA